MIALRLFLIFLQLAYGAVVIVPAEHASEADYNAYMEAHQEFRTPEQEIRKQPLTGGHERPDLLREFADAQAAFIGPDPKTSIPIFESILSKGTRENWNASERSILFQSALRLAQQESGSNRNRWLVRSLTVAPDQVPNPELFPPPLVQEWEKTKELIPKVDVQKLIPPGWQSLQVQGLYYDISTVAQLPLTNEEVRLRWISNRFQPQTQVRPLTRTIHVSKKPWLRGDCQAPHFSKESEIFAERKGFFDLSCLEKGSGQPEIIKFNPVSNKENSLTMFEEPVKKPFYKSGWFWTGVGAAMVVAIVISQKKRDTERDPSTTYGY